MTNNWVDIDYASLVYVQGANPSENHPACMGHVNAARFSGKTVPGYPTKSGAQLVVVDPRKTRTALQIDPAKGDRFIRIRPGTDIAFINSVLNAIFTRMYAAKAAGSSDPDYAIATNFFAWHNSTASNSASGGRTLIDDSGALRTLTVAELKDASGYNVDASAWYPLTSMTTGWPKYCDSRVKINRSVSPAVDYKRITMKTKSGWVYSNMLDFADTVEDADTVFQRLRTHVAKYPSSVAAGICGCLASEIDFVADRFIQHSRFASSDFGAASADASGTGYRATTMLYAMGITQHTYGSQNIRDYAILQTLMGNMGRQGGGINALRGIHNVQGSTDMATLYDGIPGYSGNPATAGAAGYEDYANKLFGNRVVGTGAKSAYNRTGLGLQQLGFYNMTHQWFGEPFAGSTSVVDASGAVGTFGWTTLAHASVDAASVVVKKSDLSVTYTEGSDYEVDYALGKIRAVQGTTIGANPTLKVSYTYSGGTVVTNESAVVTTDRTLNLPNTDIKKSTGGFTLTSSPAGTTYVLDTDYSVAWLTGVVTIKSVAIASSATLLATYSYWGRFADADFAKLYDLWPKGNGYQHTEAIRRMQTGQIKAAVVWGQNPAITEPNQTVVRSAFESLDLLVCVDMFANETAQVKRKDNAPTYLLPACSHVEEAGSVTNSGRWIQWRDRAVTPKGNSKADIELLLRFAKALDTAGAFNHITTQWNSMTSTQLHSRNAFDVLYGKHGWTPGAGAFEDASGLDAESVPMTGSEYVCEQIFKEIARPLDDPTVGPGGGGTLWIYSGMGVASGYNLSTGNVQPTVNDAAGTAITWGKANRAKVRKGDYIYATKSGSYPRYGWAWLLNRRVFYNNGEVPDDVLDVFVAPGYLSRLFTIDTNTLADWSALYRAYNQLKDMPSTGTTGTDPIHVHGGRFPSHTEPIESPRPDLVAAYGNNTSNGSKLYVDSAKATAIGAGCSVTQVGEYAPDTRVADASGKFDLVLTTIRCVEHFQGGPITRNNPWNHEAEPEPWIEINSVDAIKYGIADGNYVEVTTARGGSTTSQAALTKTDADSAGFAKGFKARVGVGTSGTQRVAPGVVAIPWHWGERGLSKGSRANDLCIDAWDANTMIPEYKACLCRIRKVGM